MKSKVDNVISVRVDDQARGDIERLAERHTRHQSEFARLLILKGLIPLKEEELQQEKDELNKLVEKCERGDKRIQLQSEKVDWLLNNL